MEKQKRQSFHSGIHWNDFTLCGKHIMYAEFLRWRMVTVKFIDGTQETYETKGNEKQPWIFNGEEQSYRINSITGIVVLPREFIKSIEHYEIETKVNVEM